MYNTSYDTVRKYMYAEIVFNQSVKTFIECHKNAFRYFKEVPGTVKIDNLKAAILETNFYEPTVQKHYLKNYEKAKKFLAN